MKNDFNIDVSFNIVPISPYNWESKTFISHIPVIRVSKKCLLDILLNEVTIETNKNILLLNDTKTSLAIKLKQGQVVARSYLLYQEDETISEYTCNLEVVNLKYKLVDKLNYVDNENKKVCDYILKSIESIKDDYKIKYLYYLYFDNISEYSKEKLVEEINTNPGDNIEKLYNFLHQ